VPEPPQFFHGSEALMQSPRERDDGRIRADMSGGGTGDAKSAFTSAGTMVALNRNAEATPLALARFGGFIGAKSRGHDAITRAEVAFDKPLSLAAKPATILRIE
jgi:hypothetical protein